MNSTHGWSPPGAGSGVVQIWGTQPDSIDEAEDRDKWMELLKRLDIRQPPGGIATTEEEAVKIAEGLGYPVMVSHDGVGGGGAWV